MYWRKILVEKWNWLNCLQQVCGENGLHWFPCFEGWGEKLCRAWKAKACIENLFIMENFFTDNLFWNGTEWGRNQKKPHWDRLKGCIWRNQSAKDSPKAVNARTSSWKQRIHPHLGLKTRIGNGRAGRCSHQIISPKEKELFLLHHY